jgi:arginine/lysine/ornithine decarboxylase
LTETPVERETLTEVQRPNATADSVDTAAAQEKVNGEADVKECMKAKLKERKQRVRKGDRTKKKGM